MSVISSAPQAEQPTAYVQPVSQRDFLDQVAVVRDLLKDFDGSLSEVRSLHQRLLDAVDAPSSSELGIRLQQIEAQTFARNEQIRKLIKTLAQDAANTRDNLRDMKLKQVAPLKTDFQSKLTAYQGLEQDYRTRRQEQIRRQYLVVNPDATDSELAAVADASNDPRAQNVFQMAVSPHTLRPQLLVGDSD
jgi:syntaxin 1B/2/3